ncbi:MAG: serine/threonine protein kinase [bacterium]|nr:serine/threonine protein kinase [bacterium]
MTDPTLPGGPDDDRTLPLGPSAAARGDDEVGAVFGPYRLVKRIGQGGMGDVFEAEQSEPIRRRVALKVIKQGMDTRAVVARFDAERQALALMDHPCIAKVYDAGATDRGRPYFVMEYVEGEPINDYCNWRKLPTRARLELFVRVCEGVQHAHQKAVIHRDLKPSNILVAEVDGRPVPKIIDFGVAKATTQRLTEMTMFTEMGQLIGTPEYMSPEQAAGGDDDIDTRTDVYALGVVLYELLAGALPFESGELRKAGYDAIRRLIIEKTPSRPSTRFSSLGGQATAVALAHGTAPQRLRSELRGDLDWITMKALEKDRDRRYETANGLAADVRRHLKNEPVTAGPPSTSYRLGKLVRRNRGAVATGSALVLMLAVLAVSMSVQAGRLARERDRTAVQAAKAEKTTEFLQSMLGGISPATARGRDTKLLEEILLNTDRRTRTELAGQPEVEAAIRGTLGQTYTAIGKFPEALANLQVADSLQSALLGADAAATLTTRRSLGNALHLAGRHPEAEAQLRAVIAAAQAARGPDDAVALRAMVDLSDLFIRTGKLKESLELGEAAVAAYGRRAGAARQEAPQDAPQDALRAKVALAFALANAERYARADTLLNEAIAGYVAAFGADHPLALNARGTLAIIQQYTQQPEAALKTFEEVIADATRVYGADHPETIKARSNLAFLYIKLGRLDEAEATHRELVAATTRIYGADNAETIVSRQNLGNTLLAQGRHAEAEAYLDDLLVTCRRVLGPDHRRTLAVMGLLASLYDQQRRFPEAAAMLGRIARDSEGNLGETHAVVVINYYNWAAKLQDMGDNRAAEPVYRSALDKHQRGDGTDKPYVAAILNGLGRAVAANGKATSGDAAAADSLLASGLAMRERMFGPVHAEVAYSLATIGEVLHLRGDHQGAVTRLRACVAMRDSLMAPDDWMLASTRSELARCLVETGKNTEAIPLLESAIKGLEPHDFTADLAKEARTLLARARRG